MFSRNTLMATGIFTFSPSGAQTPWSTGAKQVRKQFKIQQKMFVGDVWHPPCTQCQTPLHQALWAFSAPSLSGCASEPDWVTPHWVLEALPAAPVMKTESRFTHLQARPKRRNQSPHWFLHHFIYVGLVPPPRVLAGSSSVFPSSLASSVFLGRRQGGPAGWGRAPHRL